MPEYFERLRDVLGLHSRRRVLGLSFILAVAVIWVAASFAVQGIESTGVHPAVLTFIANSLFALYLPVYWLNVQLQRRRSALAPQELQSLFGAGQQRSTPPAATPHTTPSSEQVPLERLFKAACVVRDTPAEDCNLSPGPNLKTVFANCPSLLLQVAPLWFIAQLTFNASLSLTSVTSNTILSSASALFTFLCAVAFLSERFTLFKLGCIALLMAGTAMVTLSDSAAGGATGETSNSTVMGDLLCLLSSMVYGAYTVAIRCMLGAEDETISMTMFFGMMGGLIFCIVGPMLGVLRVMGVGLGTLTWRTFGLVVAKGLLDNVLSDYLWARAIILVGESPAVTSNEILRSNSILCFLTLHILAMYFVSIMVLPAAGPTLATSGLSLQVPIAVALDALFRNPRWLHSALPAVLTFVGGAVVLAGFWGMNVTTQEAEASGDGVEDQDRARKVWERHAASLEVDLGDDEIGALDDELGNETPAEVGRRYVVGAHGDGSSRTTP